jgi:hypothetical protein
MALGRGVKPGQGSGVLAELYEALGRGIRYFKRQAGPLIEVFDRQAGPSVGRSLAGGVPDTRIDQFAAVRSKDRQEGSNSKKRAAERSKSCRTL